MNECVEPRVRHNMSRVDALVDARALFLVGLVAGGVAVAQWRARHTMGFRIAAATTWVTLGPACVRIGMDDARVERAIEGAATTRGERARVVDVGADARGAVAAILRRDGDG